MKLLERVPTEPWSVTKRSLDSPVLVPTATEHITAVRDVHVVVEQTSAATTMLAVLSLLAKLMPLTVRTPLCVKGALLGEAKLTAGPDQNGG